MNSRPRRNRASAAIRAMVRENRLSVDQLIFPLFVTDTTGASAGDAAGARSAVDSLPGQYRLSGTELLKEIESCMKLGLRSFVLFPAVEDSLKDKTGTYSYSAENFYLGYAASIKREFPECCLISDVALDPYSSDGHDGIVDSDGKILNDESLVVLGKMAVAQASAGFDIIGPSDMMDGRVAYIRAALEEAEFTETGIMAYTAKYASSFYGPFRDALDSAPKSGDKKTYQMDPANSREAIREALLDEQEGADFLMVKPALSYLDVIKTVSETTVLPVAAYNVSGEYAMLMAAAEKGWLDLDIAYKEVLLSIKRAGADVILTYFAKRYAESLKA